MTTKTACLLKLAQVFDLVEITEEDGQRFDAFAEHIRNHGGTLASAAIGLGQPITHQTLYFVVMSNIANWFEGGAEAALTLSIGDGFEEQTEPSEAHDRLFVKYAMEVTHHLAWDHFDDDTALAKAGKSLLDLCHAILNSDRDEMDIAIDLALTSHDFLSAHDHPDTRHAQLLAYRLLVLPRRLPFLPDMPPSKFPPPIRPELQDNLLLEIARRFIKDGVVNQSIDLAGIAQDMRKEPDTTIKNQCYAQINGVMKLLRIELAFMDDLIDFAFEEDASLGAGVKADIKLRALLSILGEEERLLDSFRDDDYGVVYKVVYLGDATMQPDRIELSMKVESFADVIRINVGLSTDAVRANNARDHAFVARVDDLVNHIRAGVVETA